MKSMNLGQFKKTGRLAAFFLMVVVLLVVAIVGGRQAATFFAKASTCPATRVTATQVTSNAAVVSWDTADVTQGRVEYGTSATNLSFSAPEGSSGKVHNVPLTLLTPNTVYYYMVTVGSSSCDSTGQTCSGVTCVPYSLTTAASAPQQSPVQTIATPTVAATASATPAANKVTPSTGVSATKAPTVPTPTKAGAIVTGNTTVSPTSGLSAFCQKVKENIGRTSTDIKTPAWSTIQQYDIDVNNTINGVDVVKCEKSGK